MAWTDSIAGIGSAVVNYLAMALGAVLLILIIVFVVYKIRQRKAFNIPVTIWIPRSDGCITDECSGLGGYFKTGGITGVTSFRLKRKGFKIVDMQPPTADYLVGLDRHLHLVQKGFEDYEPVHPSSFQTVLLPNGKKCSVMNLKAKNQDSTAWGFDYHNTASKRFTIGGLWEKYKEIMTIMFVIFVMFLSVYINWKGQKDVVTGLSEVANAFKAASGAVTGGDAGNIPVIING